MTIWNPEISPAVEAHLTARLPGWRNLIRIGRCGAWSVPVSCEVCGKIVYRKVSSLEGMVRQGVSLPRFCSNRCRGEGRRREREAQA